MLKQLRNRVLIAIPLVLGVAFVLFVLIDLAPGDAAQRIAGEFATPEETQRIRVALGLDQPLLERYARWVGNAVQGDFGHSLINNEPVLRRLGRGIPISFSLVLISLVVSTVVGTLLGILAALRLNRGFDRIVTALSSLATAIPGFWLGLLLVLFFGLRLEWFPVTGYVPVREGYWAWFEHLVLPSLAISALFAAEIARQLRGSLADVLETDYVLAARARGIPRRVVVFKHALKNAAGPVVTISGYRAAQLVGATVIVEQVFAIRGLGTIAVEAALQSDLPVVLGITVLTLLLVTVVNLLVDLSYGYFNPKVRQ